MELLEDLIVHVYDHVAKTCGEHLADLGVDLAVPKKPFPRISYAEAIEIANRTIEEKLAFGDDLSPAAERAIGNEIGQHYFIVDWPTEIRPYYAMPYPDRPEICKAFDLMHPRMELSSGAQRIHDHDLLVERIRAKGLSPEAFEFYLRAFRYGMPPHAGWGLGIERLVMTMLDLGNIREAVLFPRDRHRLTP